MCHGVATAGAHFGQFDSFLPSVLCKETPTLSPQHTHIALCDKDLYVCRFFEFAKVLGGAIIRDRTLVSMNQFSRAQDDRRSERDAIDLAAHGDLTARC